MKKWLIAVAGLVVLSAVAQAADAPSWVKTGDRGLDGTLKQIETQARADQDGFFKQISSRYGVPEKDLRQAQETHQLRAADVFMATAIAKATNRPVLSVAEQYKQNEGKGWGVMAKEMGIKPGSKEFHALKKGASGSLSHMKATHREHQRQEARLKKEKEQKARQEVQLREEHEQKAKQGGQGKGRGK
jgi:opacity protein-like surface antigen